MRINSSTKIKYNDKGWRNEKVRIFVFKIGKSTRNVSKKSPLFLIIRQPYRCHAFGYGLETMRSVSKKI